MSENPLAPLFLVCLIFALGHFRLYIKPLTILHIFFFLNLPFVILRAQLMNIKFACSLWSFLNISLHVDCYASLTNDHTRISYCLSWNTLSNINSYLNELTKSKFSFLQISLILYLKKKLVVVQSPAASVLQACHNSSKATHSTPLGTASSPRSYRPQLQCAWRHEWAQPSPSVAPHLSTLHCGAKRECIHNHLANCFTSTTSHMFTWEVTS